MRLSLAALALSLSLFASACTMGDTRVVHSPDDEQARGIFVVGRGEASGRPDLARVELGIMVRSESAADAMQQAGTRARAILDAVRGLGIAEADVRTDRLSLYEERTEMPPMPMPMPTSKKGTPPPPPALPVVHHVASNVTEVTVRDLAKLGAVVGAALSAGANQVDGIRFELQDPGALRSQAREKAVADARAQAEQLAKLGAVQLGPVQSIRASAVEVPFAMASMKAAAQASDVPTEPGQLTVQEQVEIRFDVR